MSMVFARDSSGRRYPPGHSTVQKLLDENAALIQTIVDYQSTGRLQEAAEYQQTLHRNLVYLSNLSDEAQTLLAELQAPFEQAPSSTTSQNLMASSNVSPTMPPQQQTRSVESQPQQHQQFDNRQPIAEQQQPSRQMQPIVVTSAGPSVYYNTNLDGQQQQAQQQHYQQQVVTSQSQMLTQIQPQPQQVMQAPTVTMQQSYQQQQTQPSQAQQYWQLQQQSSVQPVHHHQVYGSAGVQQVQYVGQQRQQPVMGVMTSTPNDTFYYTQQQRYQAMPTGVQPSHVTYQQQQHGQVVYGAPQTVMMPRSNPSYSMPIQQQQAADVQQQQSIGQQQLYTGTYHVQQQHQYQQMPQPSAPVYQQPQSQ